MARRAVMFAAALALGATVAAPAAAQTAAAWNNAAGGNWSLASNWSPQTVPSNGTPAGSTYAVTIALPGTYSVTLDQPFTITNLTLNNANMTLTSSGGSLTAIGGTTFTAGTLALIPTFATTNLLFDNLGQIDIDDTDIDHAGLARWIGAGDILFNRGSVFTNRTGATFRIENDQRMFDGGAGAVPTFLNDGLFEKAAGLGLTEIADISFVNSGSVRVDTGTLRITNPSGLVGNTLSGGAWVINGASLSFNGATILTNEADVTLDGAASTFADIDPMTTNGSAGTFSIENGRDFTTGGSFTNNGTLRTASGTTFRVAAGSSLTNYSVANRTLTGGAYDLAGQLRFDGADIANIDASVTLDGLGSSLTDEIGANGLRNLDTISAGGQLALLSGRDLSVPGSITHSGVIRLGASGGDQSVLDIAADLIQTSGVVDLQGGRLRTGTSYALVAGMLKGNGSVEAEVFSTGTVAPGASAGFLDFERNYTQLIGGDVQIEIGGLVPAVEHDLVVVRGLMAFEGGLAGTLDIQIIPGLMPRPFDVFQIIEYGEIQGRFEQINGLNIGGGLRFAPEYTPNALVLTVVRDCYPDCDLNGVLDIFDFLCFQNAFVAGQPYACECDPDPVCDIFDFLCFQSAFVAGCP